MTSEPPQTLPAPIDYYILDTGLVERQCRNMALDQAVFSLHYEISNLLFFSTRPEAILRSSVRFFMMELIDNIEQNEQDI